MTGKKRSFAKNVIYLGMVQGAEYVVPLLAIPFLLRIVGTAGYGQIAFVQALSMYFVVFTEFGFNLTATRLASIHGGDRMALSALFWEVQASKVVLFALAALTMTGLVLLVPPLTAMALVVICGLLPALGNLMYPLWFLQGIERMKEAAAIMIFARVTLLGCLFLLVDGPEDLILAAALQMGATPLAGVISWIVLGRARLLTWITPSGAGAWRRMLDGRHAFFVTAASTLYRSTNAVVLGFVAGPVAVAYYSVAEKIVKAVQELARPISQAAYPRVMALAEQSREAAMPLLRKLMLAIGGLGLCTSLALLFAAEPIVAFIGGSNFMPAVPVLRLMAFVPLIGGVNSVLGVQTMMAFGYSKVFSRLVAASGVFNLLAVVPLAMAYADRGGAASYVLSELLLLVSMTLFLRARGIRYFAPHA